MEGGRLEFARRRKKDLMRGLLRLYYRPLCVNFTFFFQNHCHRGAVDDEKTNKLVCREKKNFLVRNKMI